MEKNEIMAKVNEIRKQMKKAGGGLEVYVEYEIETHTLKTALTENEICEITNCRFCHKLCTSDKVTSATLVYSAYDGIVSIIPNKLGEEESYFIPKNINHIDNTDEWDDEIAKIWNLIKTL